MRRVIPLIWIDDKWEKVEEQQTRMMGRQWADTHLHSAIDLVLVRTLLGESLALRGSLTTWACKFDLFPTKMAKVCQETVCWQQRTLQIVALNQNLVDFLSKCSYFPFSNDPLCRDYLWPQVPISNYSYSTQHHSAHPILETHCLLPKYK